MKIVLRSILIFSFIFLFKINLLISQSQIPVEEIDSICVVIYEGRKIYPLIPIPKDFKDTLELKEIEKTYQLTIENLVGKVDTSYEMKPSVTHVLINEEKKYNPTIIWSSLKCFNRTQVKMILDPISCGGYEESLVNNSSECFMPKHGLMLFNKKAQLVSTVAVCLECNQTKLNHDPQFYRCVDYRSLKEVFLQLAIPVFKNDIEFENYKTAIGESKKEGKN